MGREDLDSGGGAFNWWGRELEVVRDEEGVDNAGAEDVELNESDEVV